MDEKCPLDSHSHEHAYLAEAFSKIFISVVEVDLQTGTALTLQSPDSAVVMRPLPWKTLLARYTERRSCPEDRQLINDQFSLEQLQKFAQTDQSHKAIQVRCVACNATFEWMELAATRLSGKEAKVLITTKNVNEQRLLKSVVERFVYKNCDYFVLLDTKHNSFFRFIGNGSGADLPPLSSNDYTAVLEEYNTRYVMPYDVDRVTAELQIDHIVEMLEKHDEHEIYFDNIPEHGTTRRKHIQLAYHDKPNGLVLLTRTDITDVYLHERALNEQLRSAIIEAQTDSLTQLYNHAATADLVRQALLSSDCTAAACLFLDMDNFKTVNDSVGHLRGDELLKFQARYLRKLVANNGIIGRIGGDEFLVFLPGENSKETARHYSAKICTMFSDIKDVSMRRLNLSCSVGISLYPEDGTDYETLVHKADQALYEAKHNGKNQYSFYFEKGEKHIAPCALS
ncbi:GGDEF domain-containing protein [Gordonibacter sp.]|uniref:GGDEF domain-containing protein n=1 Tax=Gordonibacter sp. TaxID=1968902 RepID=UPI002FCAC4FD